MTEVFFHLTDKMMNDLSSKNILSGFKLRQNGKNVRVIFEDDDALKIESLIEVVESYGCALQIETDVEHTNDADLMQIFREHGCAK